MENREKTVKLLESFLSDKQVDGVCGYIVDPDGEGQIQVIVVLDIDYIKEANTKPGFIARMIRQGVKQEIEKWIGFDVYVGSTARKCEENITESISTYLRRRLSFEHMKQDIDNLVDYELNPCEFNNIGDFVAEACDILAYNYLEELQVSSKDKDGFYIALVDLFGKHLVNVYKQRCVKGLGESKKTYVVTESQYKKLLDESTYEDSEKDSVKFYKLFKRILDDKFSELTYNEDPFWSTHEDDVSWTDSEGDVITYNDYSFLVNRKFFWSLMEYLPISHHATKLMFTKYFKERFPDKFFLSVDEFNV